MHPTGEQRVVDFPDGLSVIIVRHRTWPSPSQFPGAVSPNRLVFGHVCPDSAFRYSSFLADYFDKSHHVLGNDLHVLGQSSHAFQGADAAASITAGGSG